MSLPVVYTASPVEVRAAVERIRERVRALAEPKLYEFAVALTVLTRKGEATAWQSWDSPPPQFANTFGRPEVVGAMWTLFGTTPTALLHTNAAVIAQMSNPTRIMLDVFYDAQRSTLTLVGDVRIQGQRDSVKLTIDDPSWIWSSQPMPSMPATVREYNPVNSMNQQNGVRCALPASEAIASSPTNPAKVYAVGRKDCPLRQVVSDAEPTCRLNGGVCGGQGSGTARETTKPRLLAPAVPGGSPHLVLPRTIESLVAQATKGGEKLPAASDLSLLVTWCYTGGEGNQDLMRLPSLFGPRGLRLLTSAA